MSKVLTCSAVHWRDTFDVDYSYMNIGGFDASVVFQITRPTVDQ